MEEVVVEEVAEREEEEMEEVVVEEVAEREEEEEEEEEMEEEAMEGAEGCCKKLDLLETLSISQHLNMMIQNTGTMYRQGWIQWTE
ncbi:hypothetical protein PSENEW3n2_00001803 [Picochlorum sp. SENEW3]|nr:hypothetical protein PSENEW3n2_00001803 [Picochlorum sp. SENEW3]WPT14573.1 hypothetical protein PSENEW3_00001803 [Picochlorum sp. SENEW3]